MDFVQSADQPRAIKRSSALTTPKPTGAAAALSRTFSQSAPRREVLPSDSSSKVADATASNIAIAASTSSSTAILPAGRSAEATRKALIRARNLERTAGRDLSAKAIASVLRGVQPLQKVVDAVYAGVSSWKDGDPASEPIVPIDLQQGAQHFLLSIVCNDACDD